MTNYCTVCQQPFEHLEKDLDFYQRISPVVEGRRFEIPAPTLCRYCREQQRLAFRNERSLYKGKCAFTGKDIVTIYSPDTPFTVYDQDVWWSDRYDPLHYGRDFDFSRPFFEQFAELVRVVHKLAIQNSKSENCAYTNYSAENKNCYLVVGTLRCQDCYYGYRLFDSRDVVDCYDLLRAELCYECIESIDLHSCSHCRRCMNGSELRYCDSCIGCQDCLGCINLRNKRFHILNQPYSEREYHEKLTQYLEQRELFLQEYSQLRQTEPERGSMQLRSESCLGDQIADCKDCYEAYSLRASRDCSYVSNGEKCIDCQDCNFFDESQLQYYSTNAGPNFNVQFCYLAWWISDSMYCANCFNSKNLFGCTGIKRQEFCILNKRYSQEAYDALRVRILEHMQKTGELGKFFPIADSPFAYNETVAQELHPLSKQLAEQRGLRWVDKDSHDYQPTRYQAPKSISEVPDSIVKERLACGACGKNYRITSAELSFYRKLQIAVPLHCPDCRHHARMARRNLRRLSSATCRDCGTQLVTALRDAASRAILCAACYDASVG